MAMSRTRARTFAIDNVIPAPVIAALRSRIVESTSRGTGTHWYPLEAPPRLLFEQVIQQLRRHVPQGNEFVGAEWWFRATSTDMNFPFHFDRDEAIRGSIVSPDLASILYLSNVGGPTLILEATPTRRAAPKVGTAIHPRAGRLGVFPGAFLHGVLPGQPSRWPRVTMLVNWWRGVPRLERAAKLGTPTASGRWRLDVDGRRPIVSLASVDPSRLMSKAAWLDVIDNQTMYR
jgi:hypothetical protein